MAEERARRSISIQLLTAATHDAPHRGRSRAPPGNSDLSDFHVYGVRSTTAHYRLRLGFTPRSPK
jgi:hypothetical protein